MIEKRVIEELEALVSAPQVARLLALAMQEDVTEAQWDAVLTDAFWETHREQIGALLSQLLPIEALVPETYRTWRPLVRDALTFLGTHLSPSRLLPKLAAQLQLPADTPLPRRVMLFIASMPGLQKIGQAIARNPHLDPAFRTELIQLENAIQDVSPTVIRAEIDRQLGPLLAAHDAVVHAVHLAEASVSAVVRFTWINPQTGTREPGVFKVLKPYVHTYFVEELQLLRQLAAYVETKRHTYTQSTIQVRELIEDVCQLLAAETNFQQEQANVIAATQRYADVPGVRVPRLIQPLCTATITAMTDEAGVKITDAFPHAPQPRHRVAQRLIEVLLALPLFSPQPEAVFHADPHAGNLFCDERSGDIVLFDWALTERLSRAQRCQLLCLVAGVALRDERLICGALTVLSLDNLQHDRQQVRIIHRHVWRFLRCLSPWTFPSFTDVVALLDGLARTGYRFSSALVVLRKVLFTLKGVLHDIAPELRLETVFMWYIVTQGTSTASGLSPLRRPAVTFRLPFAPSDWFRLGWSALGFSSRVWRQSAACLWDTVNRLGQRDPVQES